MIPDLIETFRRSPNSFEGRRLVVTRTVPVARGSAPRRRNSDDGAIDARERRTAVPSGTRTVRECAR